MGKPYRCPNCSGTEIMWDRELGKAVCPKDKTPLDNYTTRVRAKIAKIERGKKRAQTKKE